MVSHGVPPSPVCAGADHEIEIQFTANLPRLFQIRLIGAIRFKMAAFILPLVAWGWWSMLSVAFEKLQEALDIIDAHGAHLPGIHVASALEVLAPLLEEESPQKAERQAD